MASNAGSMLFARRYCETRPEPTLTTIISRIRKKIETDEHKYIKTAYGMGYQWIGGEQA